MAYSRAQTKLLLAVSAIMALSGVLLAEDPPRATNAPQIETPAAPSNPAPLPAATPPAPASVPTSGSLFLAGVGASGPEDGDGRQSEAAAANLLAIRPKQPKKFERHALLTVVVREDSDYESTGKGDSKKTQTFDAALQQFINLGFYKSGSPKVTKAGNTSTLPEIAFNYNNDRKNDASQQRTDSFSTRIQAEIVDVKPNGNLAIEATKTIKNDKEVQIFKLTGECNSTDVAADNSILSTQVANLSISKSTTGEVHDGTRSGWLNSAMDKFSPF